MFELDPFQKQAIDLISKGESVIVSAPTGAGKTLIAEHVIEKCLKENRKVIYTAPIKALSNQKFREFSERYPDQVGILTGDVSLNPHASTLIMTTEIFRNKILEEHSSLADYAWIIFDEIHYLDDYQRGSVWEESLIFLPEHMKLLGLSATIPNMDEFTQWLSSIHKRPVRVVKEDKRPVPLHVFFQAQNEFYDDFNQLRKKGFRTPDFRPRGMKRLPKFVYVKPNRISTLFNHLQNEDLLPAIYFVFSRRRTETLAEEVMGYQFLTPEESRKVKELFADLCRRYDIVHEAGAARLRPFIERGIAYHHAGMLPTLKEVVERLFTSRLIKAVFTTETFALGINMPARTVVFDELRKFYGRSHAVLKTRDFYQMAGRAGRRSIDTEGFVFCRINPHFIAPAEIHRVVYGEPEKVTSRFNASYATVLNLYQKYKERLTDVYPLSFHYFQQRKRNRRRAVEQLRAKVALLKALRMIEEGELTPKGVFASKVYGYELMLAEMYEQGYLEQLKAEDLAVLCLAAVYEPRKGAHKPRLNKKIQAMEKYADKLLQSIHRQEKKYGLKDLSPKFSFHLSDVMTAWLRGKSFDEVIRLTDADEGEVVRYIRMTLQLMRDLTETPVSPMLIETLRTLMKQINRDVIDTEKQLRS